MSADILSTVPSMHTFSLKEAETFMAFADGRSWEPGWLADYRKECWDKFSELPDM